MPHANSDMKAVNATVTPSPENSLNKKKKDNQPVIPPFLQKTFDIFAEPAFSEFCGWGKDDDSIFITNIDEFARVVLPKYFKHNNYASFTRQLHKYDFHKTMHNPRHGEFKHKYFLRGRPDLLPNIQRKLYISKVTPPPPPSPPHSLLSGITDEETDVSSTKDGFEQDVDQDIDFEFLVEDDAEIEMDFDQFDEIESSVERGIIAFDNERISILEKRQAHLMEENEETKNAIRATLASNGQMEAALDCLLSLATAKANGACADGPVSSHNNSDSDDDVDDLCAAVKSKCHLKKDGRHIYPDNKVEVLGDVSSTPESTGEVKEHFNHILSAGGDVMLKKTKIEFGNGDLE